jgi:hypothetical protein
MIPIVLTTIQEVILWNKVIKKRFKNNKQDRIYRPVGAISCR